MTIYLLTVNYYSAALVARLIESLPKDPEGDYEVIIINNSPDDQEIRQLQGDKVHLLHSGANLGFGKACNLGLNWIYARNRESIVWLVNPDAYLLQDSLEQAQDFLRKYPEVAMAGTEIYEPDGKIWFGWGKFIESSGTIVVVEESASYDGAPYLKADWVTGCSLLINLQHFSECPQFDADYFLYYEDFDFSRRYAQQGYLVVITNQIKIIHEPSSIVLKYGYLQLTQNIYSYLLSLEKHTKAWILWTRCLRMIVMVVVMLPLKPKFAMAKLKGIMLYFTKINRRRREAQIC